MSLNVIVFVSQEDELKRKKREERLEMIRNNVHLKYAMKRKVGNLTLVLRQKHIGPAKHMNLCVRLNSVEP